MYKQLTTKIYHIIVDLPTNQSLSQNHHIDILTISISQIFQSNISLNNKMNKFGESLYHSQAI